MAGETDIERAVRSLAEEVRSFRSEYSTSMGAMAGRLRALEDGVGELKDSNREAISTTRAWEGRFTRLETMLDQEKEERQKLSRRVAAAEEKAAIAAAAYAAAEAANTAADDARNDRIEKLEKANEWLWRLYVGSTASVVISVIVWAVKLKGG